MVRLEEAMCQMLSGASILLKDRRERRKEEGKKFLQEFKLT